MKNWKNVTKNMVYVLNVNSLEKIIVGVSYVFPNVFNKISKIGPVEIVDIDEFIQKSQVKATYPNWFLEWIEHDRFENVKYLAKGGFGTTYKAVWKDGMTMQIINGSDIKGHPVALKCLHNSQNIIVEF